MKCKEDCELPAKALGWCSGHYQRQRRGQPMAPPIRGTEVQQCSYGDGDCPNQARAGNTVCKRHQLIEWRARQGKCSAREDCPRRAAAGGLCETHYHRKRRGLPDWDAEIPLRMKRDGQCQHEDGCPRPVYARGLCTMHHQRVMQKGDAGPAGRLKAAAGEGGSDGRGYRVITVDGKRYLEHRWVMEQQRGRPLWPDEEVHHKNRIRDDNDPDNLELWTTAQPRGGRVADIIAFYAERYPEDVIAFAVEHYPDEVRQALARLEA